MSLPFVDDLFLAVGVYAPNPDIGGPLAELIRLFEKRYWPIVFVGEAGANFQVMGRPKPGDLVVQPSSKSLAREPRFLDLYQDLGEPGIVFAGVLDRDALLGSVIDCHLTGYSVAFVPEACRLVSSGRIAPPSNDTLDILRSFSVSVTVGSLDESQRLRRR